jgi:hypothetical protein
VTHPLEVTFRFLASAPDEAADQLLRGALDIPAVSGRAATALLHRRSTSGTLEIVRRAAQFSQTELHDLRPHAELLARVVRPLLSDHDPDDRARARAAVLRFELFGALPQIVDLVARPEQPDRDALVELAFALCAKLYERLNSGETTARNVAARAAPLPALADLGHDRRQAVAALARACLAYEVHLAPQLVEGLLMLGRYADEPVKHLFHECGRPLQECLEHVLRESRHPGVMSFITESQESNYPPRAAVAAYCRRTDAEFAAHVLRVWPGSLTLIHAENLRAIHEVGWLAPGAGALPQIPRELQPRLVPLVKELGLPDEARLAVLEWLVSSGTDAARLAACELLSVLESQSVQDVVIESLEAEEPGVQAWATSQLRSLEVPNAMELLLERLDSPLAEVREAARAELGDFRMPRVLENFRHIEPRSYPAVAALVRKIDPRAAETLSHEMTGTTPRRAARAARVALALGFSAEVQEALLEMSRAADSLARRAAVEVLAEAPAHAAHAALLERLHDASPRVRQAAAQAIRRWHQRQAGGASGEQDGAHSGQPCQPAAHDEPHFPEAKQTSQPCNV